jgi:hypothetical protein
VSLLDTRPDDFRERNLFYWATLGLLSRSQQLKKLLNSQPTTDTPPDLDDEALLAVLGLVAVSEKSQTHITAAATDADTTTDVDVDVDEDRLSLRELLR